ncbi:MAG: 5-formyltetrahydrofolate cyclo-ligase [Desulfobulbales bacterium]
MTQQNDRQRLRADILARRDRMAQDERSRKSREIKSNFWQLPEAAHAKCIFVYVNFRSEVETMELIRQCIARGMMVTVPLTDVRNKALLPFQVVDLARDLRPGYCAIQEPDPRCTSAVPPEKIEIAVIPGSVFDVHGGRLGYGGGYYDRFLVNDAPQAKRVGLAFEMQVVDKVPVEPHDQPLDILITENRIINITQQTKEPWNEQNSNF